MVAFPALNKRPRCGAVFEVDSPEDLVSYQILAKYKKGLVVYINGQEVIRARIAPERLDGRFARLQSCST